MTYAFALIGKDNVPKLHVVVQWNEQRLLRMDAVIAATEFRIGQTVAAYMLCLVKVLAHRLPGDRPEFTRIVIPNIHVVPRPIQRDCVGAESRDATPLGRLVE